MSSNSDIKFNMYVCITAFSMDMSNGLLPFCLLPLIFLLLPLCPPPSSLAPPLYLIAVPLMPPAQSQPRPAVSPQRFPVSSSCSSPSLSPHFLSLSTWFTRLFVRAISLRQLDRPACPNSVEANL